MDLKADKNKKQRSVSLPRFSNPDLGKFHSPHYRKRPFNDIYRDKITWHWASSPVKVKSVRWGMWLLPVEKKNVHNIWMKIKILLSKNQLGNLAKVSINRRGDMHFICLYTYDSNDVPDVFRVLVNLRQMHDLENDFLDYVTEDRWKMMEPSEKTIVRMYTSPPVSYYGGIESIEMSLREIRPGSKFGLVAKLQQNVKSSKGKIKFYNPPKIRLPFSSESRPCTYDELVDREVEFHELNCDKQPSTCYCEEISFIWAHQPISVGSIHVGYWRLYPEKENVDEIWEKIKILTAANRLGIGAKVSNARLKNNEHVIFVFVLESNGIQDFFRVLVTLRRMSILENYVLTYVTKVNDVEEATNGASEGTIVRMRYGSPPVRKDQTIESIRMYLLNLGPESKVGLVAECSEDVINFYNPPKNDLLFSTKTRPCKYDELVDFENDFHQPLCERQPSTCDCDFVSGIWAHQPISIDSIHGGKWMLFPEKENVDEIWEKVKILTAANRLGIGAKVLDLSWSTQKYGVWDDHVIFVYVHDSKDVQDVFRVLVTLRRNCLQNTFINYKTDNATLQEMYKIDYSDQSAGSDLAKNFEDDQNFFLYFSPPSRSNCEITGEKEIIQLFKNNIEPGFKRGLVTLVAELEKEPHDLEAKISFYDPPRILHPFDRSLGFVPKDQFSM